MYPKPEDDLRGWNVHTFGVGYNHSIVHADDSVIGWGPSALSGVSPAAGREPSGVEPRSC